MIPTTSPCRLSATAALCLPAHYQESLRGNRDQQLDYQGETDQGFTSFNDPMKWDDFQPSTPPSAHVSLSESMNIIRPHPVCAWQNFLRQVGLSKTFLLRSFYLKSHLTLIGRVIESLRAAHDCSSCLREPPEGELQYTKGAYV